MEIWLVKISEPLPIDTKIRKFRTSYLAEELTKRKHNVIWWASAFDHFKKEWIFTDDTDYRFNERLTIKALKGTGYKKNISFQRFYDYRIIAKKFAKAALTLSKPDIIVASMPSYDLAYAAVKYAKSVNVPILVDIRDQWPDTFVDKIPLIPEKLVRFLLRREFLMLKNTMSQATGLISVMNSFLDWGLQYAEREKSWKDKVFYLGYKQENNTNSDINITKENLFKHFSEKFVILFIGTFGETHNPSILLDCAARLQNEKDFQFILAGDGLLMDELQRKASNLSNVELTGWVNQEKMNMLLQIANVGMCTTNKNAFLFPNKSFMYFSHGLPVMSAFQGDLKDIIDKHNVGYYYPPNDLDRLVNYMQLLKEDQELYQLMSKNVKSLFDKQFEAAGIYSEYADHIEKVLG